MTRRGFFGLLLGTQALPQAQQIGVYRPLSPLADLTNLTTNWVGGKIATVEQLTDPVTHNPIMITAIKFLRDKELGLRSDGVVVWRNKENS